MSYVTYIWMERRSRRFNWLSCAIRNAFWAHIFKCGSMWDIKNSCNVLGVLFCCVVFWFLFLFVMYEGNVNGRHTSLQCSAVCSVFVCAYDEIAGTAHHIYNVKVYADAIASQDERKIGPGFPLFFHFYILCSSNFYLASLNNTKKVYTLLLNAPMKYHWQSLSMPFDVFVNKRTNIEHHVFFCYTCIEWLNGNATGTTNKPFFFFTVYTEL